MERWLELLSTDGYSPVEYGYCMMPEGYGYIANYSVLPGLVTPEMRMDILISPDGKTLYCTLCGLNLIIVMNIGEAGIPKVIQEVAAAVLCPEASSFLQTDVSCYLET